MTVINFVLILLVSYPWPMRNAQGNFDGPLGVSATLGDGRGSAVSPRFHRGIDIPAGPGTDVFSLASGRTISWPHPNYEIEGYVRVGNYHYDHLTNRVRHDVEVTGILEDPINPDRIGDVAEDHLHFQIGPSGGPYENPLSHDGGPDNYSDDGMPIVYSLDLWQSGSEAETARELDNDEVWGKVDIRASCQDRQTSGGVNTTSGIYRLEWLVRDIEEGTAFGPFPTTIFPQVQPPNNGAPVLLVYDRHNYRTASPFYYWVTNPIINNQVENRYWNTKLRQGEEWNGNDARINSEAQYPDGEYRVWVMAYDIIGNGGDTLNRRGAEDEDIILDNFKPYVDRVVIYQGGRVIKYHAFWSEPVSDTRLGSLV
ncbi:hypothetical protein DRP53_11080, partial [candidate division WOR-3 bacterium]